MIFNERSPDWTVSELTGFPVSSAENFPDRTVSGLTEFPASSAENFPDWTVSELTEFPVSSAESFPDQTVSELTAFPVSPVKKRFLPPVNNKTTVLSYELLFLPPAPPHAEELAIPVCAILELFRQHIGRIILRLVRQPLGLSLHSPIIPSGVTVLLPGAKYNSTAAVWANVLGGGRRVIRWQRQPRAKWPNQSTTGTWIQGASLLEPGVLLEMLQTVLSISVGHVYLDVAHARDQFGISAWW